MVTLINRHNRALHSRLLGAMHADRKRVFVDLLGWQIAHADGEERDGFDDEHATYLVIADPEHGEHLASLRLLRTDRPHILGDIFPELCHGPVPRSPRYREITRLCFAPGIGREARRRCRNLLACSLVEYALLTDLAGYTGVAEIGWLSQILAAGWTCRPLGLPQRIGEQMLGGLLITIDAQTSRQMDPSWRCGNGGMRIVDLDLPVAA